MSRPTSEHQTMEHQKMEHGASLRRLQLVMNTSDVDLRPEEIADLFEVAGMEQQAIAEMDVCWEKLRASHRAKDRLQHLTPSEVRDAIASSRQVLGEVGE